MPYSVTPRRMNGITVRRKSAPWASPQAATAPFQRVCAQALASVWLPTVSTTPAQRSLLQRLAGRGQFGAVEMLAAPSDAQVFGLLRAPVDATTR